MACESGSAAYSQCGTVARYSHAPTFVHWKAASHVLMRVMFTISYGITLQSCTEAGVNLKVYVDSDYASKTTDWRFVLGNVVMCASACASFLFKTQKSVTLSSMEAE